jgi:hypothetical protein
MDFLPLGDVELHYTSLEFLDYGVGGQHYGTLDGWLRGEDVRGELRLTNLAPRRPDNVNPQPCGDCSRRRTTRWSTSR